jgi:hypothetical protein
MDSCVLFGAIEALRDIMLVLLKKRASAARSFGDPADVRGPVRPAESQAFQRSCWQSLGGKWLELFFSEIAPGLKRAAIIFNPDSPAR